MAQPKDEKPAKTLLFTIAFAIEANDVLSNTDIGNTLDHLRGYGAAEVLDVQVIDKPIEEVNLKG